MALAAILVFGCIHIPQENLTVSEGSKFDAHRQGVDCAVADADACAMDQPGAKPLSAALDSRGFSLVSWNTFKGKKAGWEEDFRQFSRSTDILILQEAYLTESLRQMLRQEAYHWDMTAAFEYRRIETGVLTASRTSPSAMYAFREIEPITRLPKSVLITRYPMTGTDRELLVANIHAINFTMNNAAFQKQMDRLADVLAAHRGPMIVSGDFNTWNKGRLALVNAMAENLDLNEVCFDENHRSQIFGFDVDYVFYRGLEATKTEIPMVSTSDHNPLLVIFKLADETEPNL
jgi:endonuclease/exonuclease/phosphatase (EEP) superfamily protein YafD